MATDEALQYWNREVAPAIIDEVDDFISENYNIEDVFESQVMKRWVKIRTRLTHGRHTADDLRFVLSMIAEKIKQREVKV